LIELYSYNGSSMLFQNFTNTCLVDQCKLRIHVDPERVFIVFEPYRKLNTNLVVARDPKTGERLWTQSYPLDCKFAGLIRGDGQLYLVCKLPKTTVIQAFIENEGAPPNQTWTHSINDPPGYEKAEFQFKLLSRNNSFIILQTVVGVGTYVYFFSKDRFICSTDLVGFREEESFGIFGTDGTLYLARSSPFFGNQTKTITVDAFVFVDTDTIWDAETISFVATGAACLLVIIIYGLLYLKYGRNRTITIERHLEDKNEVPYKSIQ